MSAFRSFSASGLASLSRRLGAWFAVWASRLRAPHIDERERYARDVTERVLMPPKF